MATHIQGGRASGEAAYNARAAVPGYRDIFGRWARDSLAVREQVELRGRGRFDVAYGGRVSETLDLFLPEHSPLGTLMYIHGGYWSSLDKTDASLVAPAFNEAGYAVAVVNYALCPRVRIEFIVAQMRAAAAWLYARSPDWGADSDRLFVSGHSAGAHLAACLLGTDWPREQPGLPANMVAGAVCVSGLYDLRPLLDVPSVMRMTRLTPEGAERVSPALWRPSSGSRLLTGLGMDENPGFQEQTAIIAQSWSRRHVGNVLCADHDHFTILDELTRRDGKIFQAALQFMSSCDRPTS